MQPLMLYIVCISSAGYMHVLHIGLGSYHIAYLHIDLDRVGMA